MAAPAGGYAIGAEALLGSASTIGSLAEGPIQAALGSLNQAVSQFETAQSTLNSALSQVETAQARVNTALQQIEEAKTGANTTCDQTLSSIWQGGQGSAAYEEVNAGLVKDGNQIDTLLNDASTAATNDQTLINELQSALRSDLSFLNELQAAVGRYQQFFMSLSTDLRTASGNYSEADQTTAGQFSSLANG